MFDQLFRYPGVVRRHRDGPLTNERATDLVSLATRGIAPETVSNTRVSVWPSRTWWRRCHAIDRSPRSRSTAWPSEWAVGSVQQRRAAAPHWPHQQFRAIATEFLNALGRWTPSPTVARRYAREVEDFVTAEQRDRGRSLSTCRNRRWQIERCLSYLAQTHGELAAVTAAHLDAYFQHVAPRWSRVSLRSAALALRVWFRHCETKGWVRPGSRRRFSCLAFIARKASRSDRRGTRWAA